MDKDNKREQAEKLAELQKPAPSDDEIDEEEYDKDMERLRRSQWECSDVPEDVKEDAIRRRLDPAGYPGAPIPYAPTTDGGKGRYAHKLVPEDSENERWLVDTAKGLKYARKQRQRRAAAKKNKKEK
jgi:hypothetical protein